MLRIACALGFYCSTACIESVPLRTGDGFFVVENQAVQYSGSVHYDRYFRAKGRYRLQMGSRDGDWAMEIASDMPLYGDTITIDRKSGPSDSTTRNWARFEPADENTIYWSDSGRVWTVTKFDIAAIDFRIFLSRRDSRGTESIVLKGGVGLGLK